MVQALIKAACKNPREDSALVPVLADGVAALMYSPLAAERCTDALLCALEAESLEDNCLLDMATELLQNHLVQQVH